MRRVMCALDALRAPGPARPSLLPDRLAGPVVTRVVGGEAWLEVLRSHQPTSGSCCPCWRRHNARDGARRRAAACDMLLLGGRLARIICGAGACRSRSCAWGWNSTVSRLRGPQHLQGLTLPSLPCKSARQEGINDSLMHWTWSCTNAFRGAVVDAANNQHGETSLQWASLEFSL